MANDITTLAIALQSKEAEANLKTFNELLDAGSDKAKRMENMTIAVDVDAAVRQLAAFKQSFDDIAASAQNIHFDLGTNMPMLTPPPTPGLDATALQELKAFFQESAEEMRRQSEALTESLGRIGAGAETGSAGVRTAGETMRGASVVSKEYAAKLKELSTAQKEYDLLVEQSDANMQASIDADIQAEQLKKKLTKAQNDYNAAFFRFREARKNGNADKEREEYYELRNQVEQLTEAYGKAQKQADKFGRNLELSGEKTDEAREKLKQLKAELESMPGPTTKVAGAVDNFEKNAKRAGTTATKLARGFNAVAFAGGAAVPGLSKLGLAISMFSYSGPVIGGVIVGAGVLASIFKNYKEQSEIAAKSIRENAEYAVKEAQAAKQFVSTSEADWKRLGELAEMGSLTNDQNAEAVEIIKRLTDLYGDLGIEIDKTTGKLKWHIEARAKANGIDLAFQKETLEDAAEQTGKNLENELKKFKENAGTIYDMFGSKIGWAGSKIPQFKNLASGLEATLSDETLSQAEKLHAIREAIKLAQEIESGEKELQYTVHFNSDWGEQSRTMKVSSKEAHEFAEQLKTVKKAFEDASDAQRRLDLFNGKDVEEANRKYEAATKAFMQAQNGLIAENGKWRLETDEDASKKRLARLDEIKNALKTENDEAKRLELKAEIAKLSKEELQYQTRIRQQEEKEAEAAKRTAEAENQKAEAVKKANAATEERIKALQKNLVFDRKGTAVREKTLDEQGADRREEIARLKQQVAALSVTAARRDATAEELLQWGGRYNPATGKMNGDQKQAGWRGILSDGKGGVMTEVSTGVKIDGKEVEIPLIVPESTKEDLQRIAKIANGELTQIPDDLLEKALTFAKKRLAEGKSAFYNGDKEDESLRNIDDITELYEAQTKLLQLQTQDAKYREQLKAANEARANAAKGYVFDNKGAVLRKKTEEELNKEQQQELDKARKRVEAAEKGTVERAQAEAELTRLEIEAYNARKKTSAATVMNEARANNTRLVQGVEARSSAALALESRVFRRDDSEKAIMRDSKDIQTDIKDAVNKLVTGFTDFSSTFATVKELLQPL